MEQTPLKLCKYCNVEKPVTEYVCGSTRCKACRVAYQKQYYNKNKEVVKKRVTKYRTENSETVKARNQKYRDTHKKQISEYHKKYRVENQDKIQEYNEQNKEHKQEYDKAYRENNRDYILERDRQYYRNVRRNDFEMITYYKIHSYKIQDKEAEIEINENDYITFDWVFEELGNNDKCHYCNVELKLAGFDANDPEQFSIDRIDNNFGHTKSNCIISCWGCNCKRKTTDYYEFKKLFE